jgi:hypothetical protein
MEEVLSQNGRNLLFQKRCPKMEEFMLLEALSYGVRSPVL